eukprot:5778365-Pyramimonas_sp.AAC.1
MRSHLAVAPVAALGAAVLGPVELLSAEAPVTRALFKDLVFGALLVQLGAGLLALDPVALRIAARLDSAEPRGVAALAPQMLLEDSRRAALLV